MRRFLERLLRRIIAEIRKLLDAACRWLFRTTRIAIQFEGDIMALNSVTLTVGQSTTGTIIPLEADGVTQPAGAVLSAQAFSIPADPSFTAVDNADGTVTITAVAASTASVTGTASATVTETDGAVKSFTQEFTISVIAPAPPTGLTASIAVSFSDPA